nr:MAG TPA: hypothetical protein [Caudoviricetes sp.]
MQIYMKDGKALKVTGGGIFPLKQVVKLGLLMKALTLIIWEKISPCRLISSQITHRLI